MADIDQRSSALFDSVMSPYCPAVTLSACTSPNARSLRDQIRDWMRDGLTNQQIEQKLVESYGTGVLGVPEEGGWGMVGWLAPAAGMLLGAIVLALFLQRALKYEAATTRAEGDGSKSAIDPEMVERIESEVKKRLV